MCSSSITRVIPQNQEQGAPYVLHTKQRGDTGQSVAGIIA